MGGPTSPWVGTKMKTTVQSIERRVHGWPQPSITNINTRSHEIE